MTQVETTIERPTKRETTPFEKFQSYLESQQSYKSLAPYFGGDMRAVAMFVRVVLTAVQGNPALLDADRRTLLLACLKAASDGLMPDGKEAVFNIYSTKVKNDKGAEVWIPAVQYLPMAGGLVKVMYEHPEVKLVDAHAVYEKDVFEFELGDEPKLRHVPTGVDDPGQISAAYCIVKLTNGEIKREVMFRRDIEKVRGISKARDALMWKTFYDQGAIKSVIKRIAKQLPRTDRLERVIASDNRAMGFQNISAETLDNPFATTAPMPALEHHAAETVPTDVAKASRSNDLKERVKATKSAKDGVPAPAGELPLQSAAATSSEPLFSDNEVEELINAAADVAALDEAADALRSLAGKIPREREAWLWKLYTDRKAQMVKDSEKGGAA